VQTGFGGYQSSYALGTGSSFPGVKRSGSEADRSAPSGAEAKTAWSHTSIPPYVFMAWCLVTQGTVLYFAIGSVLLH
jgi:hypothetical protein